MGRRSTAATYNLTKAQLDKMIRDRIQDEFEQMKKEAMEDALGTAMTLMLTLPLEVLMDHYWPNSYEKRLPEFTNHVLEYYSKWENGELDMDKLREDLWVYGGVKLVKED